MAEFEKPRRGVREHVEPGVYKRHATTCRSAQAASEGRRTRCECPYSVRLPDGTRKGGGWATAATLDDARRLRARAKASPETVATRVEDAVLADFTVEFMRARAGGLAPATVGIYERAVVRIIAPALGHLRLSELTRSRLDAFVAEVLEQHPHRRTAEQALECLKAILTQAIKWDRPVPANAVLGLRMARVQQVHEDDSGEPVRALSEAQVDDLLDVADRPQHRVLVLLALDALLRRGEVIGLRWSAVQLDRRRILVSQNVWQGKLGGEKVTLVRRPKSGKPRVVAITDRLAAALADLYAVEVIGRGDPADGLVLPGRRRADGVQVPLAPDSPTQTVERLMRRASLVVAAVDADGEPVEQPVVSLHGLRHTGASLALARGVPLIVVSKQLGHGRITTTASYYAHALEDALDQFTAGLDAAGVRGGVREADATG